MYSKEIAKAIEKFLKYIDYNYEVYEEPKRFTFGVTLEGKIKEVVFYIEIEENSYNIFAVKEDLKVTQDNCGVVSEFIHRLNDFYHLCQLRIVDGLIGCWQSVNCEGIVPSNEFIRKTYSDIIFCITDLYCGLVDVIDGKTTPKEFFKNYKKEM